jgi:hypothetical protein
MRAAKKDEERVIVKYFLDKYPDLPKGRLIDHESPDFILKISRKQSLGIELTQIHLPKGALHKPSDLFDQIAQLLKKKGKLLPSYRAPGIRQVWLLIFAEDIQLPSSMDMQTKLSKVGFESAFDRTFLFDLFSGEIWEIIS